jgi:hypothetical protein
MANSAKEFWTFISMTILAGIAYMKGCRKLFKWMDKK